MASAKIISPATFIFADDADPLSSKSEVSKMNAKTDKELNQEILIGETESEELSDEMLENITGGLSLSSESTFNVSSIFSTFNTSSIGKDEFLSIDNKANKAGPL